MLLSLKFRRGSQFCCAPQWLPLKPTLAASAEVVSAAVALEDSVAAPVDLEVAPEAAQVALEAALEAAVPLHSEADQAEASGAATLQPEAWVDLEVAMPQDVEVAALEVELEAALEAARKAVLEALVAVPEEAVSEAALLDLNLAAVTLEAWVVPGAASVDSEAVMVDLETAAPTVDLEEVTSAVTRVALKAAPLAELEVPVEQEVLAATPVALEAAAAVLEAAAAVSEAAAVDTVCFQFLYI